MTLPSDTRTAAHRRSTVGDAPGPDWLVAGVAAVGLVIAGYLTFVSWSRGGALFCTAGSGCDVVQASTYSRFLLLPTALWGALTYAAIGGLAVSAPGRRGWRVAFFLAAVAASFSLYLTGVSVFVLRAVCAYCLVATAVSLALPALLLGRYPVPGGRRPASKRGQLLVKAGVLGALTVVVAAWIFAWDPGQQADAYRFALARHLATTGATFYGAFW